MITDARAALLDLLSEPDTGADEPRAALCVLQHALSWSAAAIERRMGTVTPADALTLVMALDDALSQVDDLLGLAPALAEAGVVGAGVTRYLRRQSTALSGFAGQVAAARREHEELAHVEARLSADRAEHERLSTRLVELHRMRALAERLPELREQERELARRLDGLRDPVAEAEQALLDTATQVVTLSADLVAALDDRTKAALETVRRTETEWAEETRAYERAERDLREQRAEFDKLRAERDTRLAQLDAHSAINRDLVTRLGATGATALETAGGMLAEVETVLDRLDGALTEAMTRYDELARREREVLPWDE